MAAFIRKSPGRFFLVLLLLTFSFYCVLSATSEQTEGRPPLIDDEGDSKVWSVSLKTGENYFSLPLIPYGLSWQELFGRKFSSLEEIACYNPFVAGDEAWQRFYPHRPVVSAEEKPLSLVFRVIANEPVTLWFEGQRFTEDIDEYVSLESRLKVGPGWNFLGGAFDEDQSKDDFEEILNSQSFNVDRDYLYFWNLSEQKWERLLSSSSYTSIHPGAVLMASFETDAAEDPYKSGTDRMSEQGHQGVSMEHLSYLALNYSDFKKYDEEGTDFEVGEFYIDSYTYEKDGAGNISDGSCWVRLPEGLLGFTDLPKKVRANIDYTDIDDEILKINIIGVSELIVGSGTSTERQLSEIEELFITADGILYGEGTLLSEEVHDGVSDEIDLPVRLVWNNEWPAINPEDESDDPTEEELPAIELEFPLSERTMAALRWWKEDENSDVKAIEGWRMYFHSGLETFFHITQKIDENQTIGIAHSIRVKLSSHDHEIDSYDPVPHFEGRGITDAWSVRNPMLKGFVDKETPSDIFAYDTGLITIKLSDSWDCNIYGETVDFEVKGSDKFSFHMLYTLDVEGCEVNSRSEGADSGLTISMSPAFILEGHDFDMGAMHVRKLVGALEFRGELNYALGRGSDGVMGIKSVLTGGFWKNLFTRKAPRTFWDNLFAREFFNESSWGVGFSGLLETTLNDDETNCIVVFGHIDKDWEYVAGPTIEEDEFVNVFKVGALLAYSAIAPSDEDEPLPIMANLAAKYEYTQCSDEGLPAKTHAISVMAKFNLPESWGMEMDEPSVDGIYSFTKKTFHPDSDGPVSSIKDEFTLMTNFTFSYGAEGEIDLPGGDGETIPKAENGFAIDTFTLSKETKTFKSPAPKTSELFMAFSGSAVQNRWNSDLEVYETKVAALTAFGGGKWDPALTKSANLKNLDYIISLDLNHNIVKDTFCFRKLLLSRKDMKWGVGLTFGIRTKPEYPWGSFSILPVAANKQNWFVTVDFNNFQVADNFTFKSAFAKIGKTDGQWDNTFGGILEFPDLDPVNDMELEVGAMIALATKKVTLFSNMSTSNPQLGGSNLGMSFKNITGTYDWGIKKLSVSTDWDIFCEWLKPEHVDEDGEGDGELQPIGLKVAFTKEFGPQSNDSSDNNSGGNNTGGSNIAIGKNAAGVNHDD